MADLITGKAITERINGWNWAELENTLMTEGVAKTPALLTTQECQNLIALYPKAELFRSRVEMEKYHFGRGEYQYFAYPLPPLVQELRTVLYSRLVPTANHWHTVLYPAFSSDDNGACLYPTELAEFLAGCARAGQIKPTPLILRYETSGYNCLHQDLYGEMAFPLQVVFALNQREEEYGGGELLLVEQRPRAQSVGRVLTLARGEGLIFANRYRPVKASRGYYRANLRHGVSLLQWGVRYSLGIIFHDAT